MVSLLSYDDLVVALPLQYPPELGEELSLQEVYKALIKPKKAPVRQAAKALICGWHNQLIRTTGMSFADCIPKNPLQPVEAGQRRWTLERLAVQALELSESSGGAVFFKAGVEEEAALPACWDTASLPAFSGHGRCTLTSDEGSQGWSAFCYLATQCGVSMLFHRDPCHKLQRSYERAVAGVAPMARAVRATLTVFKSPAGPWSNGKFGRQLQLAAKRMIAQMDEPGVGCKHPVFELFAVGIAADAGLAMEALNERELIAFFKEQCGLLGQAAATKSSRWMAWWDAAVQFRKRWYTFAAVLAYLRVECGLPAIPPAAPSLLQTGAKAAEPNAAESTLQVTMEARQSKQQKASIVCEVVFSPLAPSRDCIGRGSLRLLQSGDDEMRCAHAQAAEAAGQ